MGPYREEAAYSKTSSGVVGSATSTTSMNGTSECLIERVLRGVAKQPSSVIQPGNKKSEERGAGQWRFMKKLRCCPLKAVTSRHGRICFKPISMHFSKWLFY